MADARCEPPPHLRGKSGWYWLSYNGKPYHEPIWWEADPDHWDIRSGTWRGMVGGRPDWARDNGWRYLAPVPSPEAVRALVEAGRASRFAILSTLDYLRELDTCTACEVALEDANGALAAALAAFPEEQT